MNTKQKILIGFLVMLVWLVLAWVGKTPVQPFVDSLKELLTVLGVYHITLTNPKE